MNRPKGEFRLRTKDGDPSPSKGGRKVDGNGRELRKGLARYSSSACAQVSPSLAPCRGSVPPKYPLGPAREFGCPLRARSRTLLSTLVALGLEAPAKTLLFWISVSLVFWGGVLTGVAVLGFSVFESWRASVELPFLGHVADRGSLDGALQVRTTPG